MIRAVLARDGHDVTGKRVIAGGFPATSTVAYRDVVGVGVGVDTAVDRNIVIDDHGRCALL